MLTKELVNLCLKPQMLPPPHQGFSWFKSLPSISHFGADILSCGSLTYPCHPSTHSPGALEFPITIKMEDIATGNYQQASCGSMKSESFHFNLRAYCAVF